VKRAVSSLSKQLLVWFDRHGRHDLPWQQDPSAYRVWVSEIMLQQTQVGTVIPYFERFMSHFPHVRALAEAPIDEVLHLWSGLGYYARARNLHRTANIVSTDFAGEFPREIDELIALPGIGRSTAGAILALAYGLRYPILDGNVKRVLARFGAVAGWPGKAAVLDALWALSDQHTPQDRVAEYTQAVMDLGATVCLPRRPLCDVCPLHDSCGAYALGTPEQFPGAKPRKPLPEKSARFVIARAEDGSALLYRRPPQGIWGGLWSFPELTVDDDVHSWCRAMGLKPRGDVIEKPILRHTFTHFRLAITPLEIDVRPGHAVMDSDRWLWYNVDRPVRVGLAKPVRDLLGG